MLALRFAGHSLHHPPLGHIFLLVFILDGKLEFQLEFILRLHLMFMSDCRCLFPLAQFF